MSPINARAHIVSLVSKQANEFASGSQLAGQTIGVWPC